MEAPGGERRTEVFAMAPRSAARVDAEHRLMRHAVVAVIVGFRPDLRLMEVQRAVASYFRIADDAVKVTLRATGEFLFSFSDPATRNLALGGGLGRVSFLLAPWKRFRRAVAATLPFKVSVCIEGVPDHAWDVASATPLFAGTGLIDSIDHSTNCEEETACLRLWVWMANVNHLARRGILWLEEPIEVESPLMHFPELGILAEPAVRQGPLQMLAHPVWLHLDRVLDYSAQPGRSPDSNNNSHNNASVIPSDGSSSSGGPATWGYRWNLEYDDGTFPPPPPSRGPVHSRLRFPEDRDGNGGAGGSGSSSFGGGRDGRTGDRASGDRRPPAGGGGSRHILRATASSSGCHGGWRR